MAAKNFKLTAEVARELISYDEETGVLRWKKSSYGRSAGAICGTKNRNGRRTTRVNGESYKNARLVWLIVTGSWPIHYIDHIDGDPSNDRIKNLRDVTHDVNMLNRHISINVATNAVPNSRLKVGHHYARILLGKERFQQSAQ